MTFYGHGAVMNTVSFVLYIVPLSQMSKGLAKRFKRTEACDNTDGVSWLPSLSFW